MPADSDSHQAEAIDPISGFINVFRHYRFHKTMTQCHDTFQFDKYCLQPSLLRENKHNTSYMHTVYHILYNTFTKLKQILKC